MSALDAGFLYLERQHAALHIGALAIVDGLLSAGELCARIEQRLPWLRRYAQRAMPVPFAAGHPTWEDDPDFDVRDHVQQWALPAPRDEESLRSVCATLLAQPLPRSRPLWEMHVLEGLEGGRTAVFQKVHHCMIDGVSGAQLLEQILDDPGRRSDGKRLAVPGRTPRAAVRLGDGIRDGLRRQLRGAGALAGVLARPAQARLAAQRLRDAAWSALELATRDLPKLPWNAPLGPRRRLAFTTLPMAGVKKIKSRLGGSVNDVVLSVLAGGLHRYLEGIAVSTERLEVVALVPVSVRREHESRSLGNRISALMVPLAVDVSQERPRFSATRATTERLKQGTAWTGIDALLALLDGVPAPLVALAGRSLRLSRIANLVATNVPGPREPRTLCERPLVALYPIVPIADGLGLGLAVFSYAGTLYVGLNAAADLVPDLDKLRLGIEESFAALLASA